MTQSLSSKDRIFSKIEDAIEDIKEGKFVIVFDDLHRENEGDLICSAEKITPSKINFMIKKGGGLICVPLTAQRIFALDLPQMTQENSENFCTPFTVSVDGGVKTKVTTGISAKDRADTIRQLIDPETKPSYLRRPGHIFPLRACENGVLERKGHIEAAIDLVKLGNLYPAGVLCEILTKDGATAQLDDLIVFSRRHNLKLININQIVEYRLKHEKLVVRSVESKFPTRHGHFQIYGYISKIDKSEHIALVKGKILDLKNNVPLVRIHSECVTGNCLGSLRCDCEEQLHFSLKLIAKEGLGIFIYLTKHEGRGIGLINKLKAYALQDMGKDTVEANLALGFKADIRNYNVALQILQDIGVRQVKLITNNPQKIAALQSVDIKVVEVINTQIKQNRYNAQYLEAKRLKFGHSIHE